MTNPYSLPEWRAWVRAIREQPDCDNLRLICADWLDEHGEHERAEFIRVQCEITNLGVCRDLCRDRVDYTCRGCELRARERSLLVNFPAAPYWPVAGLLTDTHPHRDVTAPPVVGLRCHGRSVREVSVEFRRGFVHHVTGDLADLMGRCQRCDGDGRRRGADHTYPPTACEVCRGSGVGDRTGFLAELQSRGPIEFVNVTDMPVYASSGNSTYYVGGLGRLPREYWGSLDNHVSRWSAGLALSACVLSWSQSQTSAEVSR